MSGRETSYSAVLGVVIANLRRAQGMEQGEMARQMGLSQPSYSRLESGKSTFSVDQMCRAANVLNIALDQLVMKLSHNIEELERNGIEVRQPARGSNAQANKQNGEVGQLLTGAALGALLFGLLTK